MSNDRYEYSAKECVIHTFLLPSNLKKTSLKKLQFFKSNKKSVVNHTRPQGFRQAIAQEDTGQLYGDEEWDQRFL